MTTESPEGTRKVLWKLETIVPTGIVDAFEDALAGDALAISRFEVAKSAQEAWRVEALFNTVPDSRHFEEFLRNLSPESGPTLGPVTIAQVPDQDWIGQSLQGLAPVQAGQYFVYGHHDASKVPPNAIRILIEAGQAFGTGHHETTHGCLLALARIRHFADPPRRILDLGCGTGVLAVAAAKTWRIATMASDIDPIAARVTCENAKLNGVGDLVHTVAATGLNHEDIRKNAPYGLVFANILAGPLRALAPAIARHTGRGGLVVLSGVLASQERSVAAAFRNQGLFRWQRHEQNGWVTLTLRDRRRGHGL